jgi:hypothetical protein
MRRVVKDQAGQFRIKQIGYFAGAEEPFAEWFRDAQSAMQPTR